MIKGITDEVYKKIAPYLTIYGDGKLNINTADKLVLQTLAEGVDETMVRKAIEGRPYENTTRTKFMESFGADFKNKLKLDIATTSSFYSILAEGKVQDTRKIVRAVVKRGSPSQLLYFKVE
jgi:type II secretory pathway component PulK